MDGSLPYARSRFATSLPADRRYTASHFWLAEEAPGVWRVGFTKFAAWLMGDPVEFTFLLPAGAAVAAGEEIGWVEGLKALHTIHSVADGEFLGAGDEVSTDITLVDSDPYGRGWLYHVRGQPAESVDVHGYMSILDAAVDAVIRGREAECGGECEG